MTCFLSTLPSAPGVVPRAARGRARRPPAPTLRQNREGAAKTVLETGRVNAVQPPRVRTGELGG